MEHSYALIKLITNYKHQINSKNKSRIKNTNTDNFLNLIKKKWHILKKNKKTISKYRLNVKKIKKSKKIKIKQTQKNKFISEYFIYKPKNQA